MSTRNVTKPLAALAGLLSIGIIAGCGGGGGGSSNLQIVGSDQSDINPNSIVFSDFLLNVLGQTERLSDVDCTTDLSVCSVTYNGFRRTIPLDGDGSGVSATAYTPRETWEYMSVGTIHEELDGNELKFGIVGGIRRPNSLPASGSASWSGEMVALDANNRLVRGGAALEIDNLRFPRVDVVLSPRGYPTMTWNGIPLRDGGFEERRASSDYIKGELYGPAVEEAGGVFERNRLVGAFGAKQ